MLNELSLLDSIFNGGTGNYPVSKCCPTVDVTENDAAYKLDMDLPGRNENSVNIELNHNVLTISSKEEETEMKEDKAKETFLIRERRNSSFSRSFNLPEDVDSEKIEASFKNGVLTILMTKKEIAAPKKIAINAA